MEVIPYGKHAIDDDDIAAVVAVLKNGWLTQGPQVAALEQAVAAHCGAKHAVACSSGTAALHLAMLAADLKRGDRFVCPAVTFLATANGGVYVGATPDFCDIDPASGNMTPALLRPHLSESTRAVLPVHFAGAPCDMPTIAKLVRAHAPEAVLIEDCCHALGGTHADGTPVGSLKWSDMTVFSFHPVKHIAAGEGGMVLTDRDDLADRLRQFRNHGMTKDSSTLTQPDEGPWYYEMHEPGYNYRIPDINCALALSQFGKLDRFITRRRTIAAQYLDQLAGLTHVTLPTAAVVDQSAWHIFCLGVDFAARGTSRTDVMQRLLSRGVGTQVHYYPVPLQPYFRKTGHHQPGDFPGAERHYEQTLTIPLFPGMTDADVSHVVAVLREEMSVSGTVRKGRAA